jgi:hypothetical protein
MEEKSKSQEKENRKEIKPETLPAAETKKKGEWVEPAYEMPSDFGKGVSPTMPHMPGFPTYAAPAYDAANPYGNISPLAAPSKYANPVMPLYGNPPLCGFSAPYSHVQPYGSMHGNAAPYGDVQPYGHVQPYGNIQPYGNVMPYADTSNIPLNPAAAFDNPYTYPTGMVSPGTSMNPMEMVSPMAQPDTENLQQQVARFRPLVEYGLKEAKRFGHKHAMMEVALIAYLIGRGYDEQTAHQKVEKLEINETFPG